MFSPGLYCANQVEMKRVQYWNCMFCGKFSYTGIKVGEKLFETSFQEPAQRKSSNSSSEYSV